MKGSRNRGVNGGAFPGAHAVAENYCAVSVVERKTVVAVAAGAVAAARMLNRAELKAVLLLFKKAQCYSVFRVLYRGQREAHSQTAREAVGDGPQGRAVLDGRDKRV